MNPSWLRPASLLALVLAVPPASAAVYHWKDAQGVDHYTQTPEPGRPYEVVPEKRGAVIAPSADSAPASADAAAAEFLKQAEQRDAQAKKLKQETAAAKAVAAQECQAGRERLKFLEERPLNRLATRDADGGVSRMTSEEWESRKAEARLRIANSCKP